MNILGGIIKQDSGGILLRGQNVRFENPIESLKKGIGVIH
jgi:ABC-type uncharacterized transport system ATPase subunit